VVVATLVTNSHPARIKRQGKYLYHLRERMPKQTKHYFENVVYYSLCNHKKGKSSTLTVFFILNVTTNKFDRLDISLRETFNQGIQNISTGRKNFLCTY